MELIKIIFICDTPDSIIMNINDDAEGFIYSQTHFGDELGYYEHCLKKDHRRNKISGDLIARYNDFKDYQSSALAKDIERTIELIPENGTEVAVKDLKKAMVDNWIMSENYADKVIRELGSNDNRIKARNHTMDRSIDEIRLKKVK